MDTFQKACELAAYYQVGDVNGLIEGVAQALAREREAALEECRKQAVRILNEPFHPIGLSGLELFIEWIEEAKKSVGVNQAAG